MAESRRNIDKGISEQGVDNLKVYQLAHDLGIKVHEMSLTLPRFEMHEEGSQIRRSSKSVSSNIVEGFALRKYKNEFVHYLHRAYASSKETVEHLRFLYETKSFMDVSKYHELINSYDELNKMLFSFIDSVIRIHETPNYLKEPKIDYSSSESDI